MLLLLVSAYESAGGQRNAIFPDVILGATGVGVSQLIVPAMRQSCLPPGSS